MPLRVGTRQRRARTNIMCVKYLALTFGERVGFVSRLPLLCWVSHHWVFVTSDDPSLTQHFWICILYLLRRRIHAEVLFPKTKNLSSYSKHGLFFRAGRYLSNQRSALSSFLWQFPGKHITATMTVPYCSRVSGSQPFISYTFLLENPVIVALFHRLCSAYIPALNGVPL